jgi:hypothetical protein
MLLALMQVLNKIVKEIVEGHKNSCADSKASKASTDTTQHVLANTQEPLTVKQVKQLADTTQHANTQEPSAKKACYAPPAPDTHTHTSDGKHVESSSVGGL